MWNFIKISLGITILGIFLYFSGRWVYRRLFISDVLVIGEVGQPRFLNPVLARSPIDKKLTSKIYRGLIKYNQNLEPVGDLAESWSVEEKGKVYIVKLKRNEFWQDKTPIRAQDVIFTYKLMPDLRKVTLDAIDDFTIKFTLPEPFSTFPQVLTRGILPQHIWKDKELRSSKYNLEPVGSGSYRLEKVSLGKNRIDSLLFKVQAPLHSNTSYPSRHLKYLFFDSVDDLLNAYKMGQIDRFETTDPAIAEAFKSWPNTQISTTPQEGPSLAQPVIFFNLRNKNSPVANLYLRQTLAHQLPKGGLQLGTPLPQNHWAYAQHSIPPAGAKLDNQKINLLYLKGAEQLISSITRAWEPLSVNTQPTTFPPETEDWDVLVALIEIPPDPDQYIYWHSTQTDIQKGGLNLSGYQNRRVDKALEDGRHLLNKNERQAAYNVVQRWLAEDVPAIFIQPLTTYTISRR